MKIDRIKNLECIYKMVREDIVPILEQNNIGKAVVDMVKVIGK